MYTEKLKLTNGKEIKALLKYKGYSVHQLAGELKRSDTSLHRVINSESRSNYIETAISKITGLSKYQLWGYK